MKKKALFVINSLDCGGAEKSLVSLLSLFDYEKYDVYLQMFNNKGMFLNLLPCEIIVLPEIDFYQFLKLNIAKQLLSFKPDYLISRLNLTIQLKYNNLNNHKLHEAQVFWQTCGQAVRKHQGHYDIAFAWGQGNPTHYVADKVEADIKLAWINADYESAGHNKAFDKKYYAKYNHIVSVSDNLLKKTKLVFPQFKDKMTCILDIQNYELANKMSKAKKIQPKRVGTRIVTTGRMVEIKNYVLAVEAANILKNDGYDFEWIFVGDGNDRPNVESKIKEYGLEKQVILAGEQSNPYPYIAGADIYVQTSKFEGYCLTLAEARMFNRPSVSTDFEIVYNQLVDGQNGLIVKMTPQAVANGIKRLITDKVLYSHIQENLKKEKKGNAEEIEKIYQLFNGEL